MIWTGESSFEIRPTLRIFSAMPAINVNLLEKELFSTINMSNRITLEQ